MGRLYLMATSKRRNRSGLILLFLALVICWIPLLPDETQAETIVYRLKWLKNASTVGDIYADKNGLFEKAGLSVTVKAGGPERDAIKELELGYAQFGIASADQVIRALAKGSPVVVLAQLFQINPLQWIYHAEEPVIETLLSLKGKTIGITYGGNDETIMRTLLGSAKLTERDVRFFGVRYDYTPFYNRQVNLWPVYLNAQAIFIEEKLKAAGEAVRYLDPNQFGIKFPANSVVTSKQMVKKHPEKIHQFMATLLASWEDAINPINRSNALNCIREVERDTDPVIIEKQVAATAALVKPRPDLAIGTIDPAAWHQAEMMLLDLGQIEKPVHIENVLGVVKNLN